ncbi:hypothetical protein J6590_062768 [Homalodisca vitripennis]|nr:hypothetical protein J6590_062768 [Homalodisca vitripennis]
MDAPSARTAHQHVTKIIDNVMPTLPPPVITQTLSPLLHSSSAFVSPLSSRSSVTQMENRQEF